MACECEHDWLLLAWSGVTLTSQNWEPQMSHEPYSKMLSRIAVNERGPFVVSPADAVLNSISPEMPITRVLDTLRTAERIDETCPRIYLLAGDILARNEDKLSAYSKAVRLGTYLWQPYAAGHHVQWWTEEGTRDYLTSIFRKGTALFALGYQAKAQLHFEMLTAMDPADHLQVNQYMDSLGSFEGMARYLEPGGKQQIEDEKPRFVLN